MDDAKILAPVRYSAWLTGTMGDLLERQLRHALGMVPQARIRRFARGFLVEAPESPGPLLEAVAHAMKDMDATVAHRYPVFHREMGRLWTGTLQSVFLA